KRLSRSATIASTDVVPSQRSRISPALPLSFTMPSGYPRTWADCTGSPWGRKPRPMRGRRLGAPSFCACIAERHRVVHRPQDVELELEDAERALLIRVRAEIVDGHRQRLLDVAPRLRQAVAEILEAGGFDPRIVLGPVGEAL